jgi:hypothetical protein
MAERSKVYKLPRELLKAIERGWADGLHTLDEWMEFAHAGAPEVDISRSGLGRHLAKFSDTARRIRQAREVAAGIMKEIGASDESETGRLLAEMLSTLAMNTLEEKSAQGGADSKDLFFLSTALKNLAGAKKTEVDRELKIRAAMRAELEKKVGDKIRQAKQTGGLSDDAAAQIMAALAGGEPNKK